MTECAPSAQAERRVPALDGDAGLREPAGARTADPDFFDRIEHTYRQAAANGWAGAVAAGCLFMVMLPHVRHGTLLAWLAFALLSIALRIPLARCYFRDASREQRVQIWARRYAATIALHGAAWGAAAFLFLEDARPGAIPAFLIVLTPLVAGSIASQSYYLPSVVAFVSIALIPAIVRLATFDKSYLAEAATLILFYGFLYTNARAQNARIREANRLRRSNLELIERLSREKQESDTQRVRAESANQAKARFVAMAGHDLRQPMHALGLFAGSLREATWNPENQHLIDRILATLDGLQALVNELLDLSRLEAGHVEIKPRHFALDELVDRLVQTYLPAAQEKRLTLEVTSATGVVHTDPVLLERLLGNLIGNAIRYTTHGRVGIASTVSADRVCVAISDTGPGIRTEDQERIFEEFVRLPEIGRDSSGGLGLGLAIVRRIATLLDLRLTVRSSPGRGSTFAVEIAPGDPDKMEAPPSIATASQDLLHGRRILVIDDDPNVLTGMEELLRRWGCRPVCLADASAWPESVVASPADAILADLHLGGAVDGISAIAQLRAAWDMRCPAVVMTGDLSPRWPEQAQRQGLVLLHKPVRPARLRAALSQLLASDATTCRLDPDTGLCDATDPPQETVR